MKTILQLKQEIKRLKKELPPNDRITPSVVHDSMRRARRLRIEADRLEKSCLYEYKHDLEYRVKKIRENEVKLEPRRYRSKRWIPPVQ